ncbi:MAG TPA: phage tail length tape measure family protein, partial [Burkholderiaceae bacterium]|nr:phage tail length tape measure family protein [Burkholderiaceae bacterium]
AEKVRQVKEQATALTGAAVAQNASGGLSDDGLKKQLADIRAVEKATLERIGVEARGDAERRRVADEEQVSATLRAASAQKIIDAQNGLSATYRTQLAQLRELRDAGALTPAQFKQAGAALVAKQPVSERRSSASDDLAKKIRDEADAVKAANDKVIASNQAFIESVNRRADAIGKTPSQLLAQEAALRGLTAQTAPAIAKLQDLEAKTGQLGKGAFATRNQLLTLQYTLSDVVASAASGISPLTILLQQGGQVAQIEGGVGGVFRTLLSLVTPARIAVGGFAATVGVLAAAWYEGHKQSKEFNDQVVLSGNYAGKTEGQYNALARSISANTRASTGTAREFAQALIATGEIGPKVFDLSAEAATRYGEATGKTAKDVATEFAALTRDVTAGATKMNASMNFLSASQLQQIRNLQDQGKETEAYRIAVDALNERLKGLDANLGTLETTTQSVGKFFREMWDRVLDVGRTETIEQKIAAARGALQNAQRASADAPSIGVYGGPRPSGAANVETSAENLRLLNRSQTAQESTAAERAQTAEINKKADAASAYYRQAEKGAKAEVGRMRELAEEERQYQALLNAKAANPNVEVPSAATRAAVQKKIRDSYTDKGAVNDNSAERKAQLDQALKYLQDNLAAQQDALKFNQSSLAADYSAANISLQDYYARRAQITAEGVQREVNQLIDAQALIEVELAKGGFKNAAEKTGFETKLQETIAKRANIERDAANAADLALKDQGAAYKALQREVLSFQATIDQAQGNDAGAAEKRLQQLVKDAQDFRAKSGGLVSEQDIQRLRFATQQANALAEAQRQVAAATENAGRAEELYLLLSSKAGVSLESTEQGVYEIRARLVEQLRVAAERTQALAEANAAAAREAGGVADPKLLAAAGEAALAYARALETVDPALNRIREKTDALAQSIAQSAVGSLTNFGDLYRSRVEKAQQETADQRKAYDAQLSQLRQYLANSNDARERARLQDLIKQAEARRKSLEVDKGDQYLKTLERDVVGPILKKIKDAAIQQFITEPLEKYLKDSLRQLTGADGFLSKIFGSAGKSTEQQQQTVAITASTNALTIFTNALASSAAAISGAGLGSAYPSGDPAAIKLAGAGIDQSGEDYDHEYTRAQTRATEQAQKLAGSFGQATEMSRQNSAVLGGASSLLEQLGGRAGQAGQALGLLPRIIQLIQAAGTGSAAGGGGWWDALMGFFGGGSTSGGGTGFYSGAATNASTVGMSLAVGTNYVPYDNFKANLHKGEAVVPAAYNPAAGGMVAPQRAGAWGGGSGGGGNTYVTVEDHAGGKVTTEEQQSGQDKLVKIIIEKAVAEVDKRIAKGGSTSEALKAKGVKMGGGNPRRD